MFVVYILYSKKLNQYYTGQTQNIDERLVMHNETQFEQSSTKSGVPWTLFFKIACDTRKQAILIENHIKKMKSVKYFQSLKAYPELVLKLKDRYER